MQFTFPHVKQSALFNTAEWCHAQYACKVLAAVLFGPNTVSDVEYESQSTAN